MTCKDLMVGDYVTFYGCDVTEIEKLGMPYKKLRDGVRVSVPNTAKVTELIGSYPDLFTDYEVAKGKMDDVFLTVTGKDLPGGGLK